MSRRTTAKQRAIILSVTCPRCGAGPGHRCKTSGGHKVRDPHGPRKSTAFARYTRPAPRPATELQRKLRKAHTPTRVVRKQVDPAELQTTSRMPTTASTTRDCQDAQAELKQEFLARQKARNGTAETPSES